MASLNLGAANTRIPGFWSVDADPQWRPDILARLDDVAFRPASLDQVYMSHVLEHLPFVPACALLQRIGTWLKPHGVLWVAVPDFEQLCAIVVCGQGESEYVRNHFYGNDLAPWNAHRSGWTRAFLSAQLQAAGLTVRGDFTPWVQNVDGTGSDASGAWFAWPDGSTSSLSLNVWAERCER